MGLCCFVAVFGLPSAAFAQAPSEPQRHDLGSMDLDQLMKVQVVTASKHSQALSEVPSAIFVVTHDAIRRSGARNIPEALRIVPGVQVAQLDASKYVVSIRGMGSRFADKLLVLIDGRSVYTSLFSGVYWDAQDLDLELVDRIEVIRGPGGSLWGSNAVNGIINIITKTSKETLGSRVSARTSTSEPYSLATSSGIEVPHGAIRISAKGAHSEELTTTVPSPGVDAWNHGRVGLRGDWDFVSSSLSVTSDASSARQGQTNLFPSVTPPYSALIGDRYNTSDWNFQAKWEQTVGAAKGRSLRVSFDHYDRQTTALGERDTSATLDFQEPISVSPRLHLIWGAGYKTEQNTVFNSPYVTAAVPTRTLTTFGGFFQSEFNLSAKAHLSIGSKFEHNSYTGWEVQPSAKLLYQSNPTNTFWASITRAVQTPSRVDTDLILLAGSGAGPGGVPVVGLVQGNPNFLSEVVISHELGWRYQPSAASFVDVAAFYNQYANLRSGVNTGTQVIGLPPSQIDQLEMMSNGASAETGGLEIAAHQTLSTSWRLEETYSLYSEQYDGGPGNTISNADLSKGATPRHQASLRSEWDLSSKFQFNLGSYYVSQLSTGGVAPYLRLDLLASWKPNSRTEFSFGVHNLTNAEHTEAAVNLYDVASQIPRAAFAKVTIHF